MVTPLYYTQLIKKIKGLCQIFGGFMIKEKEMITVSDVTKKVKTGLGNGRGTLILAIVGISVSLASSFLFCRASICVDFKPFQQTVF